MTRKTHADNFAAGQRGLSADGTPAGEAAARAGNTHRVAEQKRRAEEEAAKRRKPFRFKLHIPKPVGPLSRSDMKQIDAWVEWWFDTDTLFGIANMICFAIGALGGLIWAVVSAFMTEITFTTIVIMPIVGFLLGAMAGAFAVSGALLWGLWKIGARLFSLF